MKGNWESVIGLEIHVQLNSESKIFSNAPTKFGSDQNLQACEVDLGMPGTLPVLNEKAIEKAIKFGVAINAEIAEKVGFARKNYFYPDLPKGYQISQLDDPIVGKGSIEIQLGDQEIKTIGITRAHLEEDAGKSIHDLFENETAIDLNRAGTPLLEIVSEPDMSNSEEAVAYLKKIHSIVCALEISDGNMSQGSMRCDANVSIRKKGDKKLGTRTELKNINSFKFVEKAINFEIKRQISCLEKGEEIVQETRLYDATNNTTRSMRSKEEANDYRYFPEPDIIPIQITSDQIQRIKNELPELPDEKKERFINELGLSEYDARNLTYDLELADFFEKTLVNIDDPKLVANWILGDFSAILNKFDAEANNSKVDAVKFAELLTYLKEEKISGQATKKVLENIWENPDLSVSKSIQDLGLEQISDDNEIEEIIEKVINNNPDQKEQFLSGKDRLFGFFVGQVMKESKGKANPKLVNEILKKKLV